MDVLQFMRDHQAYFEDYVTRSTYHSNAIEGSTLSFAETYAILWNDNTLKVTATARELYEAINHKYAHGIGKYGRPSFGAACQGYSAGYQP